MNHISAVNGIDSIDNIPMREFAANVSPFLEVQEKYENWFFSKGTPYDAWIFHSNGLPVGNGRYVMMLYCGIDLDGHYTIEYTVTDHKECTNFTVEEKTEYSLAEAVERAWYFFRCFITVYGDFHNLGKKRYICKDLECFNCFVDENTLFPVDEAWFYKSKFEEHYGIAFKNIRKSYLNGKEEQICFDLVGARENIIQFVSEEIGINWRISYDESEIDKFIEVYEEENN